MTSPSFASLCVGGLQKSQWWASRPAGRRAQQDRPRRQVFAGLFLKLNYSFRPKAPPDRLHGTIYAAHAERRSSAPSVTPLRASYSSAMCEGGQAYKVAPSLVMVDQEKHGEDVPPNPL